MPKCAHNRQTCLLAGGRVQIAHCALVQVLHSVAPGSENWPGGQRSHTLEPCLDFVFAGQSLGS